MLLFITIFATSLYCIPTKYIYSNFKVSKLKLRYFYIIIWAFCIFNSFYSNRKPRNENWLHVGNDFYYILDTVTTVNAPKANIWKHN